MQAKLGRIFWRKLGIDVSVRLWRNLKFSKIGGISFEFVRTARLQKTNYDEVKVVSILQDLPTFLLTIKSSQALRLLWTRGSANEAAPWKPTNVGGDTVRSNFNLFEIQFAYQFFNLKPYYPN